MISTGCIEDKLQLPNNAFWVMAKKKVELRNAWLNPHRAYALRYRIYRRIIFCPLSEDIIEEGLLPYTNIDGEGNIAIKWEMSAIGKDCAIYVNAEYLKLDNDEVSRWYPCTPIEKIHNSTNILILFEDIGRPPHDLALTFRLI